FLAFAEVHRFDVTGYPRPQLDAFHGLDAAAELVPLLHRPHRHLGHPNLRGTHLLGRMATAAAGQPGEGNRTGCAERKPAPAVDSNLPVHGGCPRNLWKGMARQASGLARARRTGVVHAVQPASGELEAASSTLAKSRPSIPGGCAPDCSA